MSASSIIHLTLLTIYVALCCHSDAVEVWQKPRRCCSPDQWEADVKNFGSTTRVRDPYMKIRAKFAYDYTNQRWAFDYQDTDNRRNNRRVVYDHQKDIKFAVTSKSCYAMSLNMPTMEQYCVPVNASHHGYYDYGLNTATVGYDVWSYDMMFTPVRVVMRTSRDGCLALQDSALSLTKQKYRWTDGEPVCVPWKFPEEATNGECFRSHNAHRYDFHGTIASGAMYNMDFRNINLTITDDKIFNLPRNCQEVDDWPADVEWINFWSFLVTRMKMN